MRSAMAWRGGAAVIAVSLALAGCGKGCGDGGAGSADADVDLSHEPHARLDVYAVDETRSAFAGLGTDVPFPALADGTDLRTPREHEESLARFVASVTPPAGFRLLVGARPPDDSFVRTFLVAAVPVTSGDHVVRADAAETGGVWRVDAVLDDAGRAAIAPFAGKRVAFAVDDRVIDAPLLAASPDAARLRISLATGSTRNDARRLAARLAPAPALPGDAAR